MNARLAFVPAACLLAAGVLAACQRTDDTAAVQAPKPDASGFVRGEWPLPTPDGAAQPDLVVAPNGKVLLSWVRRVGDRNALQYAAYEGEDNWESAPRTIAIGRTLSANWANTPHILMTDDGALWAHWLQGRADGNPHAADVMLTQSRDGGMHWAAPVAVNDDGTATEHGFVSLWPARQDSLGIAWLDGRNTASPEGAAQHAEHGDGGRMTLRAATFDAAMRRTDEHELDASACDCCNTDAAATAQGALVVYRDRDDAEIRDIHAVRHTAQGWTAPVRVHADGWEMPACPVNGPALDAQGDRVVVAWYTAAGDAPALRIAHSGNGGASFAAPIDVDSGETLQGRVDVALDEGAVWLVWLREDAKGQSLQLARYDTDPSAKPRRVELAKLQGRGRATGFPQIAVRQGTAYVAWTDIVDGRPQLRGMRVAVAPARR